MVLPLTKLCTQGLDKALCHSALMKRYRYLSMCLSNMWGLFIKIGLGALCQMKANMWFDKDVTLCGLAPANKVFKPLRKSHDLVPHTYGESCTGGATGQILRSVPFVWQVCFAALARDSTSTSTLPLSSCPFLHIVSEGKWVQWRERVATAPMMPNECQTHNNPHH